MSFRTCAIICTFNGHRRFDRCIDAVLRQTRPPDVFVVVDNGSTEAETVQRVAALPSELPRARALRVEENCGPAGGFATGMNWAVEQGFDHVWLLDDDSAPDPSCLEQLLDELGDRTASVIWPRNVNESGGETQYRTWRGPLFSTEIIRRCGVPNREWVWGQEDTEYFHWRLPKRFQAEILLSQHAIVRYTEENAVRKRASWHYYYLSRNTIYYRLRVQGDFLPVPRRARRVVVPLTRLFTQIALQEDRKLLKFRRFALGIAHGLQGRLGKTFEAAGP